MFNNGSRSRDAGASGTAGAANGKRGMFSVLGTDVVVTGNVKATDDLHIDGRIEGDVECGNLVQGAESVVVGCVAADAARLAGTVEGGVRIRQLTVERSARITGDVEYDAITIETGARVEGRLKHLSGGAGQATPLLPAQPDTATVEIVGES